jgi:hypothetical protein
MLAKTAWRVNGQLITSAEIRIEIARIRNETEREGCALEDRLALPEMALDRLIDRALVTQEANRRGLAPGEQEVRKTLADLAPRGDWRQRLPGRHGL